MGVCIRLLAGGFVVPIWFLVFCVCVCGCRGLVGDGRYFFLPACVDVGKYYSMCCDICWMREDWIACIPVLQLEKSVGSS